MDDQLKDKFPQARSFEEFRSEISIIELATAHGYVHEVKKGWKTPVFYNPAYHDRIIIINPAQPANQGYWNPEDETDKGSLITFVKRRLGTIFPQDNAASEPANVNRVLYSYLRQDPFVRRQNRQAVNYQALENVVAKPFLLDFYQLKPLWQTDFLSSRNLAPETFRAPEFTGKIFNVRHTDPAHPRPGFTNTAFPYFGATDDKMVGLEIRNKGYKSQAEGSDRGHGVWLSNRPATLERIVLVESALDALAYHELKKQRHNQYISYGGNLSLHQIQTIRNLKARGAVADNFHYVLASDNDRKGAYYDLMFIRDLAAGAFPSQRQAHVKEAIKLVFTAPPPPESGVPAPGSIGQLAADLKQKLKPYHDTIDAESQRRPLSNLVRQELESDKITLQETAGQLEVVIPNHFFALHTFNQKFIQVAGLEYTIRLDKPLLNDYNDDLRLLKLINQHPDLLADLNKKDLRRPGEEPLRYLDLQYVMLQPGRYEQIGKIFGLAESPEAQNPVLKFDQAPGPPGEKPGRSLRKGRGGPI